MEYRRMGKTGLQLSLLSYGSWVTFHKQLDDTKADELMGIAYDNGVNFFDNAEVYSRGESEKLMGRVLKNKKWDRTSYTVSSKAFWGWHGPDNKPTQKGLSRKHLTEACHEALQRMQLDYLDMYLCHRPDKSVPMEEVVWTMNILIQQGKILYWGTSEESWLFAKYGIYYDNLNKVFLRDSVIVINIEGDTLRTPELWWDQSSGKFYTDKPARLDGKDKHITGNQGLEATQDLKIIQFKYPTGPFNVKEGSMPQ